MLISLGGVALKKLPNSHRRKKKSQCLSNSTSTFYITFMKEIESILYFHFSKTEAVHSFQVISVTIISKLEITGIEYACHGYRHTNLQKDNSTLVLATYKMNNSAWSFRIYSKCERLLQNLKLINIINHMKRLNKNMLF